MCHYLFKKKWRILINTFTDGSYVLNLWGIILEYRIFCIIELKKLIISPLKRRGWKEESVSLSEEFFNGEHCAIDEKVKMIYDGKDNEITRQYVAFTKVYDEQVKLYGRTGVVVNTINICKNRDVLKEYLLYEDSNNIWRAGKRRLWTWWWHCLMRNKLYVLIVVSERKEVAEKAAVILVIGIYQEIGLPVSET